MADRKLIVEIAGDARSVNKAFKSAGKSADTFHGKVTRAGRGIAKGLAVAGVAVAGIAVALGIKAVTAAAAFEKSMSRVVGLAGQSRKQVAQWSDQLIGLGPALAKSPQELAEALYFISSSGVPASKALSVLTASAKASTAGLGETEVVADAVTSVMNAYASSGMTAARATNVLVATVREGKGEADAFAGVIGNVAAFASRLSVRFEEVGAALAAMTQLGTDPRTAATQLQAFFSSMLKQTDKAKAAAHAVGFEFDQELDVLQKKGLLAVLEDIKDKFAGNTQAMAAAFPNIRALRNLLALTADDGGKVAGVFQRMSDSSGSLKTAFAAASQTSSVNIDRFKAALSALQIAFGQGLLPMVNKVAIALGKKLMDPEFVGRVRKLGLLIGTGLLKAFTAISTWFAAHWPQIQHGFRMAAQIAKRIAENWELVAAVLAGVVLKSVIGLNAKFLIMATRLAPLFAFLLAYEKFKEEGLMGGGNPRDWKGYIPGAGWIWGGKGEGDKKKPPNVVAPFSSPGPRAHGGPVMPGVVYRVGERGPETFVPSTAGTIIPNGGGGMHFHGPIYITAGNVRQLADELGRYAKSHGGQTRGRHGGSKLAFG